MQPHWFHSSCPVSPWALPCNPLSPAKPAMGDHRSRQVIAVMLSRASSQPHTRRLHCHPSHSLAWGTTVSRSCETGHVAPSPAASSSCSEQLMQHGALGESNMPYDCTTESITLYSATPTSNRVWQECREHTARGAPVHRPGHSWERLCCRSNQKTGCAGLPPT